MVLMYVVKYSGQGDITGHQSWQASAQSWQASAQNWQASAQS
jgi:hypothetical protein